MGAPSTWTEIQREQYEDETGIHVRYVKVSSEDIDKHQLDPSLVTLETLISNGITIDSGTVQTMLNPTDQADLESKISQMSTAAYEQISKLPNFDFDKNTLIKEEKS